MYNLRQLRSYVYRVKLDIDIEKTNKSIYKKSNILYSSSRETPTSHHFQNIRLSKNGNKIKSQ